MTEPAPTNSPAALCLFLITVVTFPSGDLFCNSHAVFKLPWHLAMPSGKRKHSLPWLLGPKSQIPKEGAPANCLPKKLRVCFHLSDTPHIWGAHCTPLPGHCLSAPNPTFLALLCGTRAGRCTGFSLPSDAVLPLPAEGAETACRRQGPAVLAPALWPVTGVAQWATAASSPARSGLQPPGGVPSITALPLPQGSGHSLRLQPLTLQSSGYPVMVHYLFLWGILYIKLSLFLDLSFSSTFLHPSIINSRRNTAVTDSNFEVRDGKSFHLSEFKSPIYKPGVAIPPAPPTSILRITLEMDCDLSRGRVPETQQLES